MNETEQNGTDGMEWNRMEGNGMEGQALVLWKKREAGRKEAQGGRWQGNGLIK